MVGNNYIHKQVIIAPLPKEISLKALFPLRGAQLLAALPGTSPAAGAKCPASPRSWGTQPCPSLPPLQPPACPDQETLVLVKQMKRFIPFRSPPHFFFIVVVMRNCSKETLCYQKSAWAVWEMREGDKSCCWGLPATFPQGGREMFQVVALGSHGRAPQRSPRGFRSLTGFSLGPSSGRNAALSGPRKQITSASQTAKKCNLGVKCAAYTKPRSNVSLVSPNRDAKHSTVPFSLAPFCIYNIFFFFC